MRKKGWILVIAFCIGAMLFFNTPERRTMRYFHGHASELNAQVFRWQTEGSFSYGPGLCSVNVWDGDHDIVEYIVVSQGIVPASRYYGFFYSPDDVPVSFQNSGHTLTLQGQDQWTWQEGAGGNHGSVKRIEPHWYFFEASL